MLGNFSVLYAGHVLEERTSASTARRTTTARGTMSGWPCHSASPRTWPRAWKTWATTRCGWPSITSSAEGYETIPNLMMLSVWLSQFTQRLKFGCGFNILPMWHPIRLAEDFAMADILTGGRVIFGVGRGYHTREVEAFGARCSMPTPTASCSRSSSRSS